MMNVAKPKSLFTCPSAIMRRTWYCPPLSSTIVMAFSIMGAKDVGPVTEANKDHVT